MSLRKNLILLLLFVISIVACTDDTQQSSEQTGLTQEEMDYEPFTEIDWDALVPEAYRGDAMVAKYQEQLDKFEDSDAYSPEADALYQKIIEEMNNAPVNKAINNQRIKLPGFIAPLNNHNGLITEFLLVPYFGACIHVPPPPVNQTVLIKTAPDNGIKMEDSFGAFWVSGQMKIEGKKMDIGEAGYTIENAIIETYTE